LAPDAAGVLENASFRISTVTLPALSPPSLQSLTVRLNGTSKHATSEALGAFHDADNPHCLGTHVGSPTLDSFRYVPDDPAGSFVISPDELRYRMSPVAVVGCASACWSVNLTVVELMTAANSAPVVGVALLS
jgi:hypothetical protein